LRNREKGGSWKTSGVPTSSSDSRQAGMERDKEGRRGKGRGKEYTSTVYHLSSADAQGGEKNSKKKKKKKEREWKGRSH